MIDENMGIGVNGSQPIFINEDLKRFKSLTENHTVVMGRKTFDTLPNGKLKNRRNIILSKNKDYITEGCEVYSSKEDVFNNLNPNETVFIIGGGEIYNLFMDITDDILLTVVHKEFDNVDTYFPHIDLNVFENITNTTKKYDEVNNIYFTYYRYFK